MPKNLVIVESPAKAKTIEKYLGKDFKVLASVGHIRKDTKVDKSTFDVTYEIDEGHKDIIKDLKSAAEKAEKVWLATDEDREGEAISWHLTEVLKLPKSTPRITFHEITKPALEAAIEHPRRVDMAMVSSQQARQTLDMLVGYDLSDIVRRKVPGAISAGRVQSPALRLIVEREHAIEKHESKSTFKITGDFGFATTLNHDFPSETTATHFLEQSKNATYQIAEVKTAPGTRKPNPPFTTASLQIEANARLGFSSRTTMQAAQALYQAGHITYHRTDSLNLSQQAIGSMAHYIESNFGQKYLKIRKFHTKDASAQEAHEAIRPSHIEVATAGKTEYERKLYALIRARTLATQMADAQIEKTTISIEPLISGRPIPVSKSAIISSAKTESSAAKAKSAPESTTKAESTAQSTTTPAVKSPTSPLAAPRKAETAKPYMYEGSGEIIVFDGFLRVYGRFKENQLPSYSVGEKATPVTISAKQTFSKPPARYTEGSLVKKLEELGIGRPSTYASIMTAIQARGYVVKGESEGEPREVITLTLKRGNIKREIIEEKHGANKGKLLPTPIGELISGFLSDNFQNIVDYKFTANIEKDLDLIAEQKLERVQMLRDFYGPFHNTVLIADGVERYNNARLLGHHPKDGKPIYAKIGKNGGFIQLGENEKVSGEKPRFAPLPKRKTVKTVTLEQALKQLALPVLPRSLGNAPDGAEIIAAAGPFGPYLKGGKYNIPLKDYDPYTITLTEAIPLYEKKRDSYIADWGEIQIINGAYGPYVKGPDRRNFVRIPKEIDPKSVTLEQAEQYLKDKPKKSRHAPRKSAKKSTKTGAKKTAKKAASTKKSTKSTKK